MERILKRYFWAIQLGLVLVIALIGALVVNNVITGLISPLMVTKPPSDSAAANAAKEDKRRIASLPTALMVPPPEPPEKPDPNEPTDTEPEPEDTTPVIADGEYPLSDINVNLNGTLVAKDPRWSTAILIDLASRGSFFVAIGDKILDTGAKVVQIDRDRIVVDREGGAREQIDLEADGPPKGGAKAPARPSPAKPISKPEPKKATPPKNDKFSKLRAGINKKNENEFTVSRNVLNEVIANPGKYRDGTKPIPHYENGKPAGFKLTRMRPGSIYNDLGLQANDVISSVNGKPLTGVNVLLDFYQKFNSGNLDGVTLEVKRRGQTVKKTYNVGK